MRAEFNDFPTSYAFFGSSSINFRSETCNVWILNTYQLDIVVNYFGSLVCSIQIWNGHYENRIQWFFDFICIFLDLSWSLLGLKHVFLDPWYIPIGSWFQSIWVSILFNLDLKLPLWEQNLIVFQLHLHFFGSFMINFGSETCIFRSLIYTDWILFSILLGHYFAQFRSETAIMRTEFNDFPTSSAFFLDLCWSILCLKHVFLDPWYIPIGSRFQSFWVIMLFSSELKLPLWEQSLMIFLLHMHFLDLPASILDLNYVMFGSLIHTNWILLSIILGH